MPALYLSLGHWRRRVAAAAVEGARRARWLPQKNRRYALPTLILPPLFSLSLSPFLSGTDSGEMASPTKRQVSRRTQRERKQVRHPRAEEAAGTVRSRGSPGAFTWD